ncbi:MAG: hypothetical protein HY824_00245 [Acidobacteria bacterium]|nr:hypothetical protein [Acidobacteriota bacterium]
MTKVLRIAVLAAAACGGIAPPAAAHHSSTMFDGTKQVTMEGVVKEFQFTNPHSWLLVDVTNPDGTVTTWGFEAEGPTALMQAGIRRNALAPGAKITITGFPMRDGRPAAAWTKAVRATDGVEFYPRGKNPKLN